MIDLVETIRGAADDVARRRAWLIEEKLRKGAGCRGLPLGTPGGGRAIIFMHEWPEPSFVARYVAAILGPFAAKARCFCGEMKR